MILMALIVLGLLATRKNRTLGLQQTLQFDDFFFTVVQAAEVPSSETAKKSDGVTEPVDYLVSLRVDNRAKRVPFSFDGQSLAFVKITDGSLVARPRAERLPGGNEGRPVVHVLRAGESATYDYVFSLSRDHKSLCLRVMTGGVLGDLLEWLFFGRQEFALP
jgi:hypothetical protein